MELPAASQLAPTGLSDEQLLHFAEHGWLLLENVIGEDDCRSYIESIDRMLDLLVDGSKGEYVQYTRGNRRAFREPHLCDPRLAAIYGAPGMLEAFRQLVGVDDVRYRNSIAASTDPDPERASEREVLMDPSTWSWHRDLAPRRNVSASPRDSRLIESMLTSVAMYFTPIAPEHGVTAFLDGSHVIECATTEPGELWDALKDRCEIVQPTAGAGSIVFFSESTVHASTHVLSDQRRVATFSWVRSPWINREEGKPAHAIEKYADERLKAFFSTAI